MTWSERLRFIYKERGGIKGFYRGILPGSLRSFFGNGWGMVVSLNLNLHFLYYFVLNKLN